MDLPKAIDNKASYDTEEENESRMLKKIVQNVQSKLNAILVQFQ